MKKKIKILIGIIIIIFLIFAIILFLQKPSHNRNWELGQEKLPRVEISGDRIKIENFRDFVWDGEMSAKANYVTKNLNFSELKKTEFIISHFSKVEGIAHVFLKFIFADGEKVIVSMETRREVGEEFSPTLGLFRKFETIYILGSEEDIIGVRKTFRKEGIFSYPTVFAKEESRNLFQEIISKVNEINAKPKFYNTLFNNCVNSLTRPIKKTSSFNLSWSYRILFPGYLHKKLYDIKMIENPENKSFEEIKSLYQLSVFKEK